MSLLLTTPSKGSVTRPKDDVKCYKDPGQPCLIGNSYPSDKVTSQVLNEIVFLNERLAGNVDLDQALIGENLRQTEVSTWFLCGVQQRSGKVLIQKEPKVSMRSRGAPLTLELAAWTKRALGLAKSCFVTWKPSHSTETGRLIWISL